MSVGLPHCPTWHGCKRKIAGPFRTEVDHRDASVPLAERVEAYCELAPELTDKKERIELPTCCWMPALTSKAKVEVTIAKARALRYDGQLLKGIEVLSDCIDSEQGTRTTQPCLLLIERGASRPSSPSLEQEKSVSQTLDDLYDALTLAEGLEDMELINERTTNWASPTTGTVTTRPRIAHWRFNILNHTDKKELAMARFNSARLLDKTARRTRIRPLST